MKTSINIWSFHGIDALDDQLALAQQAGFEGIELDLSEDGPLTERTTPAQAKAVLSKVHEAQLQLSGLATGLYWGSNPVSADSAVRQRADEIIAAQIRLASALEVDTILVVPGCVGADFIPNCEIVPYNLAYQRATAFIERALPLAESSGVTIALENVWNKFLLSPLEMRDFIDQFKSERVGSYLDVGNALATGYPEHWIEILGPRIRRVHFKDYRRAVGTVDGFVDLLAGDVNWPAVVKALKSIGYKGWIAAEMIPPVPFYRHGPDVLIRNTWKAMNRILSL